VITGILKEPVEGRVALQTLNLEGDRQADLAAHGGPDKAVYAYPIEHYEYWWAELGNGDLPWGAFGENFTVNGLDEETVHIGDRFRIGSAEVTVTQPRLPCYKLGIKFGRDDMVKKFLASGRTGFYFAVAREGEVAAGDPITLLQRDPAAVTVASITHLYTTGKQERDGLRRAVALAALPENWRRYFQERLAAL
jgi:MOSC domain-containing protein YiiM